MSHRRSTSSTFSPFDILIARSSKIELVSKGDQASNGERGEAPSHGNSSGLCFEARLRLPRKGEWILRCSRGIAAWKLTLADAQFAATNNSHLINSHVEDDAYPYCDGLTFAGTFGHSLRRDNLLIESWTGGTAPQLSTLVGTDDQESLLELIPQFRRNNLKIKRRLALNAARRSMADVIQIDASQLVLLRVRMKDAQSPVEIILTEDLRVLGTGFDLLLTDRWRDSEIVQNIPVLSGAAA